MNTRLKNIREEFGLSQEEFGIRIGIMSRSHISGLESGRKNITDRIINDVCRVFGVSEDWLRYGREPMFLPTTGKEKIAAAFGEFLSDDDDPFMEELILFFLKSSPDERNYMKNLIKRFAATIDVRKDDENN